MQHLIEQERFEIEVLDRLNTGGFLRYLIFYGGTMLRLCHGLDRFSIDLDFRMVFPDQEKILFEKLHTLFSKYYALKDAAQKFFTLLFELQSHEYPQRLKIEIRKSDSTFETEQAIAYSPHSNRQVLVHAVTLQGMMAMKTAAFLDRGEIRDAYDLEFLVKRGISLIGSQKDLKKLLGRINSLSNTDYRVKLGSILEPPKRSYYREHNFRILKSVIEEKLASGP
ncbi:nucleotidyl transferase AbiEii/AbiGii toxin family protein [Thermodesulfobacteriota bacterium]